MATDYWIKLYIEILDDPKMATLPDRLWRRTIELFLMAGRCDFRTGILPETKYLAWILRMPTDELEMDLRQIESIGIIKRIGTGWIVSKFADRQAKISDADRQRYKRERDHRLEYYGTGMLQESHEFVTLSNVDTESESESDTEADTEAEEKFTPSTSPDLECEKIWQQVTGQICIPIPKRQDVIEAIQAIKRKEGKNVNTYLTEYYQKFRARYPNSPGVFWCTEWAVTGKIPDQKNGKNESLEERLVRLDMEAAK
jgi:hypothetical protein